ncbi:hypothetical protein ACFL0L_01770 [Patescibacteria group bacterium]
MGTIDFKDDIVDADDLLQHFSYKERMEKLYPVMKQAKASRKKQKITFKLRNRTCEFIVDKEGTGSLRKKPITGWF